MKELFEHYKKFIIVLAIPYLILLFLLVTPMDFARTDRTYHIINPGGLTEVEDLIQINYNEDKEITGSISTIYVLSVNRPTYFQFFLSTLTATANNYMIEQDTSTVDTTQDRERSFLQKDISVDSAIIVAYTEAAKNNPAITVDYIQKTIVYSLYVGKDDLENITLGDEFISALGDDNYLVTDISELSTYTVDSDVYEFTFKNEETGEYTVSVAKDEADSKFGISFLGVHVLDEETLYPTYVISDSNIGGPSGGLLQTLAIYNQLLTEDLTQGLKIAGTGTINYDGSVGYIGGIEQKVFTAYQNGADIMFVPALDEDYYYDNYQNALEACEKYGIDPEGFLIPVATFQDVIDFLEDYHG